MDVELRNQVLGGACLVGGVVALIIGAPGLLGLLMIVIGMVVLGLALAGHSSPGAFFEERRAQRRRRPRG